MSLQRLIVPFVLDRLDCQNLQGMFVEAMRSQHRHLAEIFQVNEAESLSAVHESWQHLPFLRDYHAQTRILEAKELHDYISSEFWTLVSDESKAAEGLQNLLSWEGVFKAYFLTIFPQASLAPLQERLQVEADSIRALASELSHHLASCFLESFLDKRKQQIQPLPHEQHLWDVEMVPALSQSFRLKRPVENESLYGQNSGVWQQMRGLTHSTDLHQNKASADHLWLPWVNEEERHGKYERFLIYNSRMNIAEASSQALFLMFIPESSFGFIQKSLRRYLECLSGF